MYFAKKKIASTSCGNQLLVVNISFQKTVKEIIWHFPGQCYRNQMSLKLSLALPSLSLMFSHHCFYFLPKDVCYGTTLGQELI